VIETDITDKGRDAVANLKWKKERVVAWPGGLWVPVATFQVVAVTGIMSGEKEAMVEFTWKWKLTPIGEKLAAKGMKFATPTAWSWDFDPDKLSNGEAVLKLYDDGWRITNLSPEEIYKHST
jgi:hypothetical protein